VTGDLYSLKPPAPPPPPNRVELVGFPVPPDAPPATTAYETTLSAAQVAALETVKVPGPVNV